MVPLYTLSIPIYQLSLYSVAPGTNIDALTVTVVTGDITLTVTCVFNAEDAYAQGNPATSNFFIYSNGIVIHSSTSSEHSATVQKPDGDTVFTCVAGNYLGNTTAEMLYIIQSMFAWYVFTDNTLNRSCSTLLYCNIDCYFDTTVMIIVIHVSGGQ